MKNKTGKELSSVLNQSGQLGYVFLWLMGVPASLLLVVFLIKGH